LGAPTSMSMKAQDNGCQQNGLAIVATTIVRTPEPCPKTVRAGGTLQAYPHPLSGAPILPPRVGGTWASKVPKQTKQLGAEMLEVSLHRPRPERKSLQAELVQPPK
jgi:hypothetical protein